MNLSLTLFLRFVFIQVIWIRPKLLPYVVHKPSNVTRGYFFISPSLGARRGQNKIKFQWILDTKLPKNQRRRCAFLFFHVIQGQYQKPMHFFRIILLNRGPLPLFLENCFVFLHFRKHFLPKYKIKKIKWPKSEEKIKIC